jgi:hypothetical protein
MKLCGSSGIFCTVLRIDSIRLAASSALPGCIAGMFVTEFSLVDECEKNTLDAILVTPLRLSEMLLAKAGLGFILAVLMAYVTLLLNGA